MYFVPDDTQICGYYECEECGERFLDVKVVPYMVCPYCGEEVDGLLSLARTGGDFSWIQIIFKEEKK